MKKIISMIIILLTLTGCVKMEVNMEIRKDKSMTLGIIQAANESLINQGTADLLDEEEKKEFQESGYKIEDYKEKEMVGYKITKDIKNIDEVSTEEEVTSDLGLDNLKDNNYIFTVKKGLFKNTYKATLKNSDTDKINDSLNNDLTDNSNPDDTLEDEIIMDDELLTDEDLTFENDITIDDDETLDITEEDTNNSLEDFDYSALMSGIEVSMKVKLPYKALSNNATTVENDGTSLTWDLMKFEGEEIKFEFEMYNTKNIIILSGTIILFVIIIIFIIIKKSKKNKKKQSNNIETTQNIMPTQDINQNQNTEPNTQTIEQNPNTNPNQQQNIGITPVLDNQTPPQIPINEPAQEQQINNTSINNIPVFEPIQNQTSSVNANQQQVIFNPTMNQTQSINNINQVPTTLNNNISVEPVMETSNIFENQESLNQPLENNNQIFEPIHQVQNGMNEIFNQQINQQPNAENNIQQQIPSQPINQSQPMITSNIQQTSNEIFPAQEQPQLNQVQQPINLESMPNPMNLEQIGVSTIQQQQVEEQNIPTPKPSQYDSILSNNTDN